MHGLNNHAKQLACIFPALVASLQTAKWPDFGSHPTHQTMSCKALLVLERACQAALGEASQHGQESADIHVTYVACIG